VAVLERILPALRHRGYRVVTLSELAKADLVLQRHLSPVDSSSP
jgi:acetolactate synthase regulatory subunit